MIATAKTFLRTLSSLTLRKTLTLMSLTLRHPLFSLLGFYATVRAFILAKKYFPKTNSSDGIGNAFRHALWASLIMMYCCKISSPKKSLDFCKKMTDLHEDLFPNEPMQKLMDLHNNAVGMNLFMEMLNGIHRQFFETSFLIDRLLDKTKTAVKIDSGNENVIGNLIYLHG